MPERRKHPRFALKQPVHLRTSYKDGLLEFAGHTMNASAGGVYLITDARLTPGSDVDLTIVLSPRLSASTNCRVLRVTQHAESGKTGIAVECLAPFTEITT